MLNNAIAARHEFSGEGQEIVARLSESGGGGRTRLGESGYGAAGVSFFLPLA